jgi:hypothetical protein
VKKGTAKVGKQSEESTPLGPAETKPVQVRMRRKDEATERAVARTVLDPSVNHAYVAVYALRREWQVRGLNELREEMEELVAEVAKGDTSRPESLLLLQAISLDAIYGDLARLAYKNWNSLDVAERLLRLAFKAQSQSRMTVESLAELKNPRSTVIARQANVSGGHQQVNNDFGAADRAGPRTRDTESEQSKLLEQTNGERLDTGAAGHAIGRDSAMATVGAIHRPDDECGQG